MKAYVKAASKKDLNLRLQNDETIYATVYSIDGADRVNIRQLDTGAVVSIYSQTVAGNPVAKSYGQWNARGSRLTTTILPAACTGSDARQ